MSKTTKKILLIIALLGVAALIAWVLYLVFFKKSVISGVITPGNVGTTGTQYQLPTAGQRTATSGAGVPSGQYGLPSASGVPLPGTSYYKPVPVQQVVSDYALFTSLNNDGILRYHNGSDGKFYERLPDGTVVPLSDQVFYNVKNVIWGNQTNQAVIEYPDSHKIIYNFENKKQITIPGHWENFSFSPNDAQLAAKSVGLAPENRWLITFNNDGTGTKIIEPMGKEQDKVQVSWSPNRQTIAFSQTAEPIGGDRKDILLIGQNNENFRALTTEGYGFVPNWSPSGQRLLYSVYSSRSNLLPELWISNAYGDSINTGRKSIKLNTWADRCTFASEQVIYCAVPRELPQGAGMMPEIADYSDYDLVKVDLTTNIKTNIPLGDENYKIETVQYDQANNKILFTDRTRTGVFEANL